MANFTFGGKSALAGRTLQTPFARYAYVPQSGEGLQEHIFCYQGAIPGPAQEPALYQGATVEDMLSEGCIPEERTKEGCTLRYPGIDEIVMLLTLEADDLFRLENPELIKQNELFRIDN